MVPVSPTNEILMDFYDILLTDNKLQHPHPKYTKFFPIKLCDTLTISKAVNNCRPFQVWCIL